MGQIVNPVTLEKGLRAEFMKAYEVVENGKVMTAAMKVASSAASEKFGWLGSVPQMQEFKDEKSPKGLLDFNYTIMNVPYEATLKVDKFALRNDQLGATQIRIRDLAARAKTFPIKLLMDLLVAGTTQLCYDGLPMFSASHVEGASGTQSNLLTGTGVTLAQVTADFLSARTAMMSYLDDQGQPMFEDTAQQDLLIVAPPSLQGIFEQLLNSTVLPNNGTNVLYKAADLAISSRLSVGTNDWYLMNRWGAVKPLVLQENMPIEFGALEGNSESGFMRRFYHYGVEWYGNVGYGMWQKAVKINNT
jgi:phage major head subunit gpT-like protein